MAVSGSARCAATATVNELTTATTTAQPTAASITGGRVSQAREPDSKVWTVLWAVLWAVPWAAPGTARWNAAEVAAPASPRAAELNSRR
ncbi:MAG TPA: hypothetical protein VFW50_42725 [Streptosporangiaceae bacterium]|nr:hypothetical protein [Streptosporangiaceae bacterium]